MNVEHGARAEPKHSAIVKVEHGAKMKVEHCATVEVVLYGATAEVVYCMEQL